MAGPAKRGRDAGRRSRSEISRRLEPVRVAWNRIPPRVRRPLPVLLVILLAVLYPLYIESLPTSIPIIREFPSVDTAVLILIFVTMAVGLNIVVGYAGLLDLGYVAFFAIGAYTAAWLASGHFQQWTLHVGSVGIAEDFGGIHISIWLVLIAAALVTGIGGIIIGLPTLRLRGDYLAIVTLGFGEIIPQVVTNGDSIRGFNLTNGTNGINPIDAPGFGSTLGDALGLPESFQTSFIRDRLFFWTALVLLLVSVFSSVRLRDSRLGRAWIAIREDETAAGAMGVPLMRTKTWSYALGAFFGGAAGAYYASYTSNANPSSFLFQISVFLLCMVVLGGMGSIWGVVVAGTVLAWLNFEGLPNIGRWLNDTTPLDFDVSKYQAGIYGTAIVLMMLFRPEGLIPEGRRKREIAEYAGDQPVHGATS